jgi:undecaprenyl-diphosphatase
MLTAVILGLVQGLTEFLPVSSSGHLQILPYLFGLDPGPLAFDVAVHFGTLVAVVAYFFADLREIAAGTLGLGGRSPARIRSARREFLFLGVASVPAALAGFLLEDVFEETFGDPRLAAVMLLVTAGFLLGAERLYASRAATGNDEVSSRHAITMGLSQALAIIPGISRSGATIATGMGAGLTREAAARFSFLMSVPVIFGAFLAQVPSLSSAALAGTGFTPVDVAVGMVVAAVSGYLAVRFLMRMVTYDTLRVFAWYVIGLSAVTLVASVFIGPPA